MHKIAADSVCAGAGQCRIQLQGPGLSTRWVPLCCHTNTGQTWGLGFAFPGAGLSTEKRELLKPAGKPSLTGLGKLHMDYWDADRGEDLPNPALLSIPFPSGFGIWSKRLLGLLLQVLPCSSPLIPPQIWKSGIWKGEQSGGILTKTPSREFESRILLPGQDPGGCGAGTGPELREAAGASPSRMAEEPEGQRIRSREPAAQAGGEPGGAGTGWEPRGRSQSSDCAGRTNGTASAAGPGCFPKGTNKQPPLFPVPVGAGTVPPSHRAQGTQ